ncbi:MAG: hypothetical protein ACE37K_06180 [Planctomycetota bacterium]
MPFALLLQKALEPLVKGSRALTPWVELVWTEALLIRRARSAFLVHWFGERLPLAGSSIRITIANLPALATRYREVLAGSRFRAESPSLAEPLAGLAGNLAGTILSPGGAIAFAFAAVRFLWRGGGALVTILQVLAGLIAGPVLTTVGLVGGALAPLGGLIGISVSASRNPVLMELSRLLESSARMIPALNGLIDQLLGPRSGVRNPLLRRLLKVFDSVAGLLAQAMGAVAIIVTRLGPLIIPWTAQVLAFRRLFQAVADLIGEMITSAVARVQSLLQGKSPLYVLRFYFDILAAIERALPRMFVHVARLLIRATALLLIDVLRYLANFSTWINGMRKHVLGHFLNHYVLRQILAAVEQIQNIISVFGPLVSSSPSPPSSGSSLPSVPLAPPPPRAPQLPTVKQVRSQAGGAPPFELTAEAIDKVANLIPPGIIMSLFRFDADTEKRIEQMRLAPPSIFGRERARIRRELAARGRGPTTGDAFKQIRREEIRLRQLLFHVVGTILPPRLRAQHFPPLLEAFRDIEHYVYEGRRGPRPATPKPDRFPVRELPNNGLLFPAVDTLTIEAVGWERDEVETFRDQLVRSLGRAPYSPDGDRSSSSSPSPLSLA